MATTTAADRFASMFEEDAECEIRRLSGGFALCSDAATSFFVDFADVTDAIMDRYERGLAKESADEEAGYTVDHGAAYTELLGALPILKDEDVPADVLAEAREEMGIGDDESVCRGW